MTRIASSVPSSLWLAVAPLLLASCALPPRTPAVVTLQAPVDTAASSPGTPVGPRAAALPGMAPSGSAPAPAASPAGTPPAFATVIKDAKKVDGLLTLWQRDEKLWIELSPQDFGKPMFLSPKVASGIGESPLFGGSMSRVGLGGPQLIEFRRVHNTVQMIARNTEYYAKAGTPESRAVQSAFSPSLLGNAPLASQPHPNSKAVLVEANGMFVSDMLGIGSQLQRTYRQGYALDVRNSAITGVRGKPELTVIEVQNHYAAASIASAPPGATGVAPSVPRTLPDPRSLFVGLHYSVSRLPEQLMRPRKADARVGYFATLGYDFGNDVARTPKLRMISRWRLDKKDPQAALSEPAKPITYWLDRTIPEKYRGAITAGVLEWNKAFERIGYKNAIVVKVQPDDADFDTLDADRASIRWMTNASPRFGAIGPSHVDPRSGEILDADIALESLSSRSVRALRAQILGHTAAPQLSNLPDAYAQASADTTTGHDERECVYAEQAAEQLGYALDVLEARGELDPESPEAERFVLEYLQDTTMHEVGHTLGLRHNFRASRAYSEAQVSDPEFTRTNGISASVMDYQPINLPRPGMTGGSRFQLALGPYDYWAIEYGYKDVAPERETQELLAIARRGDAEPTLGYGTDEDNFLGFDPESLHFDLGNDALAFARKRFEIAHDLLRRQESRELANGGEYAVLRRSINYAIRDMGRAASVVARQIGGLRTLRDAPGSGRDPLQPVSPQLQRETLELLTHNVLAADGLVVSPALQRRLAPDFLERGDAINDGDGPVATDYSVTQTIFDVQRTVLNQLMSDAVAMRILDGESKADRPSQAFRLSELVQRLTREVWSELDGSRDIPAPRRELQREHLNKVATLLLRPSVLSRADARSLWRMQARDLLARINATLKRGGLSAQVTAHLRDSAETLGQALSAPLQRAGA
jgi:hypothetical protein